MQARSRAGSAALQTGGLLIVLLATRAAAADGPDPAEPLERAISEAENSLREGELQTAESRYRTALLEGWLLMGGLEATAGRLAQAREAFRRASASAVETRRPLQSLSLVHLQLGEAAEAVRLLTPLVGRDPKDLVSRRLLAQAMVANGQAEQAVQELEEARLTAPDDLELGFLLASGYLAIKKVEAAERLFAQIRAERPIPQTHVLIGRTYRDFGEYDRAEAELRTALEKDPRVRRAHYYLGMVAVLADGASRMQEAIEEFRKELELAPDDLLASLRLGMALVEAHQPTAALPALERAARAEPAASKAHQYLGRCLLALDRPAEAVAALNRALELARDEGASESELGGIHYQLGLTFRRLGDQPQASTQFGEAERHSAMLARNSRESLARYLSDLPEPQGRTASLASLLEASVLAPLTPSERQALWPRVRTSLARAYLNLGVLQAQRERFARAAELFEEGAGVDPEFPQLQYSLGVARFNAQQFDEAREPLARALAASPQDAGLKRMLAMACLNTEAYEKAAELLRADPELDADPSLQFAYGLALVRSERGQEAQAIFSRLLARHGDSAELSVVLGQAHAQQGDYGSAIESLRRALQLKADVAEANATLGVIYLKQGRLTEAEQALRSELEAHPADMKTQHHLATVLDLRGRPDEAVQLLRALLKAKPEFADARYLLGKLLLARGAALEAVEHLEAAARLAPQDANIHYQLAQAFRALGRTEQAERQFEIFRKLKDQRRGGEP